MVVELVVYDRLHDLRPGNKGNDRQPALADEEGKKHGQRHVAHRLHKEIGEVVDLTEHGSYTCIRAVQQTERESQHKQQEGTESRQRQHHIKF